MSLYYNKPHGEKERPVRDRARRPALTVVEDEPAPRGLLEDEPATAPAIREDAPRSARTTVRRRAGRARYDSETIDAILDEGLVAHVAFTSGGQPYAIPMLYARGSEEVYLHGSPLSRLVGRMADGIALCLTVTLIDGLVLARSAFHHSVNYRSVVALGTGYPVVDPEEKRAALETVVERVVPGRSREVRGPSGAELEATEVIAMEIVEASAKVRSGPPVDAAEDDKLPVWAGEVPLRLTPERPKPDGRCGVPVPEYVERYERSRR
jgi:nitroimidazol reductase NimA-like FMN-containing flavoprotein (pyridoxamine 5'-phosphate oxidase superfamily)